VLSAASYPVEVATRLLMLLVRTLLTDVECLSSTRAEESHEGAALIDNNVPGHFRPWQYQHQQGPVPIRIPNPPIAAFGFV